MIAPRMSQGTSRTLFVATAALVGLALMASLSLVFAYAPVERQMGIAQKIFYFHVPSAMAMYVGIFACVVGSIRYLAKRDPRGDALGVAGAELTVLYFAILLTTGPLWARKAWGVYWTWDPRLTTTMLAGMIYLAYLALRSLGEAGEAEKRFAAGLAIAGAPMIPLIHYSVQRWRGVHPTVVGTGGGGLEPRMGVAFAVSMGTILALALLLLVLRYRIERLRQRTLELTYRAEDRGLLEAP